MSNIAFYLIIFNNFLFPFSIWMYDPTSQAD